MGAYADQGKSVCRAEKRTAMFPRIEIFFAHHAPSIDWPINGLEHAAAIDGFNQNKIGNGRFCIDDGIAP